MMRNPIALAFIAIILLIVAGSTFSVVPETKQAVVIKFGEPQRVINPYRRGQDFGQTGAGLIAKWPFIENIVWIDKRVQSIALEKQRSCRPTSSGSRSTPSRATGSPIPCACTSPHAPSSG